MRGTYIPVPQVSANEDDEKDRPLLGSPPSIVYGSRRGEHQFELVFPDPSCDNEESSSPVRLLAREPLLFDTTQILTLEALVYMFRAFEEFAHSIECVAHSRNS